MKQLLISLFFLIIGGNLFSQDSVRIYGQVTDFNDYPLDSVTVRLKNKSFENLYETISDKNGYYNMKVERGSYYCLYAIRLADYGKKNLEYWAWNIPAYTNLELNPKYERMEIYGMNAIEPQVTPHETYMVYFRPMSLTKAIVFQGNKSKKEIEQEAITKKDVIDLAPTSISPEELNVTINDFRSDVVSINKITEYARGTYLYAYLIQIKKPLNSEKLDLDYDKISIVLHSKETEEYGMGECFVKRTE